CLRPGGDPRGRPDRGTGQPGGAGQGAGGGGRSRRRHPLVPRSGPRAGAGHRGRAGRRGRAGLRRARAVRDARGDVSRCRVGSGVVSSSLTIAGYALRESTRRRVFLVVLILTVAFLGLYAWGAETV